MKRYILSISLLLVTISCSQQNSFMKKWYDNNGVRGTIIISALNNSKAYVYNEERSRKRFLPASTFKIPNTLIALEEGIVKNADEIIKWDGHKWQFKSWNKDQSIRTALPISCVWFYQELAKRTGNDKYLKWLKKLNYGNMQTGKDIDTFWLNGDLRISAEEQINFLKNLYENKLPFNKDNMLLLKELLLIEQNSNYKLYAKTGLTMRVENQIGWYVGFVETEDEIWIFASNLDIKNPEDEKYRKESVLVALRELNII